MYGLAVGALFKNETHILKEWLEHYLARGVEHFYLIDDSSTDTPVSVLQPYIDRELVTLFQPKGWSYYLGRQRDLYNTFLLPCLKETQWLLICDLDEFVWSPREIDLRKILAQCAHMGQIQIEHTIFGSNGVLETPPSAIAAFTRRSREMPTQSVGNRKYILNSSFEFVSLNVHHAEFVDKANKTNGSFILLGDPWFRMNHYCCQSRQFWTSVKCTRGDSDNYRKRTEEDFIAVDLNEVEDTGLLDQQRGLRLV